MIANIIYDSRKPIELVNNFMNITNDVRGVDFTIPTLIIGWKLVKNIFPDKKVSILNKKINENIRWTFTSTEKRVDYERDINIFMKDVFNKITEELPYYFIDILKLNDKSVVKVYEFLSSSEPKSIYIYNKSFAYIYYKHKVVGFDIGDLEYIEEVEKFYEVIKLNVNNTIFYNENFLKIELRKLFYDNKIIIPYLHYMSKGVKG